MSLARAAAVRNISIVMEGENEGSVIARSGLLAEQVLWQARAPKQSVPVVIPRAAFLHLSLREAAGDVAISTNRVHFNRKVKECSVKSNWSRH
jgi:hypothetical protein